MIEAYPLQYPQGWERTPDNERQQARFDTSFSIARDSLVLEIERLGGELPVLSTNIELRRDGLPYASRKQPADVGAAVYFNWHGNPVCFACDKWISVKDNIQSIRKTIEALRGIERWGASDMLNRAFTGFAAIGNSGADSWRAVLECMDARSISDVKTSYRNLVKKHHPDAGGDTAVFQKIQAAYEQAIASFGDKG